MDNINYYVNKVIKILMVALLCIMLTIISIFVSPPSFADTEVPSSIATFVPALVGFDSEIQNNTVSTSIVRNNGVIFINNSEGRTKYYIASSVDNTYAFCSPSSRPIVYACSTEPDGIVYDCNNYGSTVARAYMSYDESSGLYYAELPIYVYNITIDEPYYSQLPMYDSVSSGLTAVADALSAETVSPSPATIIVRPGNVAYIGYDEGYCNLSVRLDKAVKSFSSNTRIGYSSSRPAEGSTLYYDNSTGNSVSWTNSQPRDILGRSTYFTYHETFNSVGYFIIYNPAYDDAGNVNIAISAEFSSYTSVVQFPLTTSLVDGSTVSTGNSDEFYMSQGEDMMSTPGVPTYIYTGTDGTTSSAIEVPSSQYNYYAPEENEEGLLSGFVQRIVQLLSAPVKHIQNLFNEGLTFMTWLSGLWSWLPVEVVGILTSALIVLIVVGVIKVFWK